MDSDAHDAQAGMERFNFVKVKSPAATCSPVALVLQLTKSY